MTKRHSPSVAEGAAEERHEPGEAPKPASKDVEGSGEAVREERGVPATVEPARKKARAEEERQEEGGAGASVEEEAEGAGQEEPEPAGQEAGGAAAWEGAGGAAGEGAASAKAGVLEEGRVTFFYRPKVEMTEVSGLSEVQRFYMLLAPSRQGANARLAVVGKKRLPSPAKHERFFGFIEAVGSPAELAKGLGPQEYETKTRGTRHLAPARALGYGAYTITEYKGGTNLVYRLELPAEPAEVQQDFEVAKEGSFILTVKNPEKAGYDASGQPLGLEAKAEYSEDKRAEFKNYAWVPARDPGLLDFPRCEILLVGAAEEPQAELGEEKGGAAEQVAEEQFGGPESDEEELVTQLRAEVDAENTGVETAPVETGEWT